VNVSIDRIENGVAALVLQDDPRERIYLKASLLPPGCVEGDVLTMTLERDNAATAAAKERVDGLIKKLQKHR
jgi:hypothetical protein